MKEENFVANVNSEVITAAEVKAADKEAVDSTTLNKDQDRQMNIYRGRLSKNAELVKFEKFAKRLFTHR